MILNFDRQVIIELQKLIDEKTADVSKRIMNGFVTDYATYRECVGRLAAFKEVSDLFGEAHEIVEKKK